ncbi:MULTISPECIES: NUDIX domain-containing protein [Fusobacterium]|uniref:NUDIX domain-containing protein n=1 Tax=Fusobacterium TaxID=848 RepID=UPI001477101D|nr:MULTISPECIES: NUDIX hydrolase [Fusobacterium]NME36121.1 NUDIX hydrolase [Fusobacterium sp. FSA-380-WT-3A]
MEDFVFLKPRKMSHPVNGMTLEYLEKQSAIAALLVSSDGKKGYFVEQFRPGIKENSLEVIAGLIDEGEIPKDALYREVREEGGYSKEDYDIIYEEKKPLAISPGYTEEKLSLYILKLKKDVKQKELKLDEGEDLIGKWFNFEEILEKSQDFKTFYLVKIYEYLGK